MQNESVLRGCEAERRGGAFPSGAWERGFSKCGDVQFVIGHFMRTTFVKRPDKPGTFTQIVLTDRRAYEGEGGAAGSGGGGPTDTTDGNNNTGVDSGDGWDYPGDFSESPE